MKQETAPTMPTSGNAVGKPLVRIDGRLKVTGKAEYSAEFDIPGLTYAALVESTIARGRIKAMDTRAAEAVPGVLAVITHLNAPKINMAKDDGSNSSKPGEQNLAPLQSAEIFYNGQHIGLVVAETFEAATYAASLIKVKYDAKKPVATIEQGKGKAYPPKAFFGESVQVHRGETASGLRKADVKIEQTYTTPTEHHNPMEMHATIAVWDGPNLTIYDTTQGVMNSRNVVAQQLGISPERVQVISRFLGGGFGCKGFAWAHTTLAAAAAQRVGRPVRLVVSRKQMFTTTGHRPETIQKLTLGATKTGQLTALRHETTSYTSLADEFLEPAGLGTSRILYSVPNLDVTHSLAPINRGTPTPMRAPGESVGTFALESAMDELAVKLGIDPVQLRLINYAETNPHDGKPWSSKHLRECYAKGAAAFGWASRTPKPGSMRDGNTLIGWGMATATYPGYRFPAAARVEISAAGYAIAASATHDIGTGSYTIFTQIAADALGMDVKRVSFLLGDSKLPPAPVSGGSMSSASVGPAVREACKMAREKVMNLARRDKASPLYNAEMNDMEIRDGRLFLTADPSKGETYSDILNRAKMNTISAESSVKPGMADSGLPPRFMGCHASIRGLSPQNDAEKYAFQSFGAQFAEVRVDPTLGTVRVSRVVSCMDAGTILNPKTAESQVYGGVIFGIGMATHEHTWYDSRTARPMTHDLAEYHVPVHADIPKIDVLFIGEPDPHISSIGSRGVGEIGITGMAAAIANAVYHATGKRIRDLPITLDKVM